MDKVVKSNTLIVGQGIAGSLLAWELTKRGHTVHIVDNAQAQAASNVSAGVLTPITGKRFVMSWEFDRFYEKAIATYRELENFWGCRFFFEKDTLRLFQDKKEKDFWIERKKKISMDKFVTAELPPGSWGNQINDQYGSLRLRNSAWCDIEQIMSLFRKFFQDKNMLTNTALNYADIYVKVDKILWKNVPYDDVIFCEGYRAKDNPWFCWLPFNHAKGEILSLETDSSSPALPDMILNFGKWFLPYPNGSFRAGSTYEWDHIDCETTQHAANEIMARIQEFIAIPLRVTGHQAGVRPIVKDLKPVIGFHPKQVRLGIFNGLGAKGVLRAPYLAKHFADALEGKIKIWDEVNIARFDDSDAN